MANSKQDQDLHPTEMGPPVEFKATTGGNEENQTATIRCHQSPGSVPAKYIMAQALSGEASRILFDYSAQAVAMQLEVDGMWENMPIIDRQNGDMMLAVFKTLAHLDPADRQSKQTGEFIAKFEQIEKICSMESQGTPTGERVLIKFRVKKDPLKTLSDLGCRDSTLNSFKKWIGVYQEEGPTITKGLLIVSAPENGGGLSTVWRCAVSAADRFMRDFVAFEPDGSNETSVENISINHYGAESGLEAIPTIEKAVLREPDGFAVPEISDPAILEALCDQILTMDRMAVVSVNANSASEALAKVCALGVSAEKIAEVFSCSLNMRLSRRLCSTCKQPFLPHPQLLQQLGLPQTHVQELYQQYQPNPAEMGEIPPCPQCNGRGFKGRIGLFELLEVNDHIKQAIISQPNPATFHQIAEQSGMVSMRQDGVVQLAQGTTSMQELQRALA